jgi:hypothetical protein
MSEEARYEVFDARDALPYPPIICPLSVTMFLPPFVPRVGVQF